MGALKSLHSGTERGTALFASVPSFHNQGEKSVSAFGKVQVRGRDALLRGRAPFPLWKWRVGGRDVPLLCL